jgi:hypothetical protein
MKETSDVGALQRLEARAVFAHEAYDFTTWLEANIDALSGVLGIELVSAEREKNAGDFSADLLAEDESGRRIIIENQLEPTDHKHLGQVLTYLTVLDAEIAIWVTSDARPEHVSAVSWLNENTSSADFYLVKVEGVRVDNSRPAPLFTRIVGPSPETRAAEQTKKEWDERDRVRYEFFDGLLARTSEYTTRFHSISPKARGNIGASGGHGFSFGYAVLQHESRVFLWVHFHKTRALNDAAFAVFEERREEIESNVDYDLEWVQDENRRRLILHRVGVGYKDEDQWERAWDELAACMSQLESALVPYLDDAREAAARYSQPSAAETEEASR